MSILRSELCPYCRGTGKEARTSVNTTLWNSKHWCLRCDGKGFLVPPNYRAISKFLDFWIKRSHLPIEMFRGVEGRRTWYIWILSRYYGYQVALKPLSTTVALHRDPWLSDMQEFCKFVAQQVWNRCREE